MYTVNFYAPATKGGGHINLPLSIRPSGYRYIVCPAISSYSFGATALIFCRMLIQNCTHNGGVHVHRILIFFKYSQNDR